MSDKVFAIIEFYARSALDDTPMVGVYTRTQLDQIANMGSRLKSMDVFTFTHEGAQSFLWKCVELGLTNKAIKILREHGHAVAEATKPKEEEEVMRAWQSVAAQPIAPMLKTYECHICHKKHYDEADVSVMTHGVHTKHAYGTRNVKYCTANDECARLAADKKWGTVCDD